MAVNVRCDCRTAAPLGIGCQHLVVTIAGHHWVVVIVTIIIIIISFTLGGHH